MRQAATENREGVCRQIDKGQKTSRTNGMDRLGGHRRPTAMGSCSQFPLTQHAPEIDVLRHRSTGIYIRTLGRWAGEAGGFMSHRSPREEDNSIGFSLR